MMTRRLLQLVIGALAALPTVASGQVCNGSTSFANGSFQVSGSADFNDNAKSFGGGLAFGGAGPFGQFALATTSFDDFDGSSRSFAAGAGYQLTLGQSGLVHLCPIASVAFTSGPNNIDVFGDGSVVLDLSETDFVFGLAVGGVASQSGQTQIIPTGSLALVNATLKATDDVSGASDSESESFGVLGLGLGFVFDHVLTLRPNVSIPFGLDGASTSFGVTIGVSFGQTSRSP